MIQSSASAKRRSRRTGSDARRNHSHPEVAAPAGDSWHVSWSQIGERERGTVGATRKVKFPVNTSCLPASSSMCQEYYAQNEAERYHRVPKAARVQAELTHAAAALGELLPTANRGIVLDLGAGGGLSTLTFQALAAESGSPPFIIGFDTSAHMLATASEISESSLVGIRVPGTSTEGTQGGQVDISDGVRWVARRGDRILADMSQPLPLRKSVADAVLSVSAVQWLIESRPETAMEDACTEMAMPQAKLTRLFASLRSITVETAKLAMQFYPPKGDHDFGARVLRDSASCAGWLDAAIVLDFPHHPSSLAKKWFLTARASRDRFGPGRPAWCALCWPVVVACCALQCSAIDGPGAKILRNRAEQQHAELALRLVRCGRRLQASVEGDDAALGIQERLRQQLHPLQLELATGLFQALERSRQRTQDGPNGRCRSDGESEAKRPKAGATVGETKTELRNAVMLCLPELLQVLHTAPSQRWLLPPPPLWQVDIADGL